jgi:hypothetical protein
MDNQRNIQPDDVLKADPPKQSSSFSDDLAKYQGSYTYGRQPSVFTARKESRAQALQNRDEPSLGK